MNPSPFATPALPEASPSPSPTPSLAVLGLGLMGGAIALRLHRQGLRLRGWNRTLERAETVAAAGISLAPTPAAAIARAELVLLVLSDAQAVDETLAMEGVPALLAGRTLIQMATIAPEESRALAQRVTQAGGAYLEAPVLGSLPEALSGRLIIMTGGDADLHQRVLPLLVHLGTLICHVGGVGQAAALKLALNQLIAGLTASFSLSLGLVRAEGLEVASFMTLLRQSALYASTFDKKLPNYLAHDYARANFPLKHLLKDVRLFERVASPLGLDAATTAAITRACERGLEAGWGDQDYSALYEALVAAAPRGSAP